MMDTEHEALKAIKAAAPSYSSLQFDWEGDNPAQWRPQIKRSPERGIIDLYASPKTEPAT